MKKCTNPNCPKGQKLQPISCFHKKGERYNSRCKICVNKSKKEKRLRDKKKIHSEFVVEIESVNEESFAEIITSILYKEKTDGERNEK